LFSSVDIHIGVNRKYFKEGSQQGEEEGEIGSGVLEL